MIIYIIGLNLNHIIYNMAQMAQMQEIQVQSLCWEDPLKKEMATHSNILAWRFPRTEELAGL